MTATKDEILENLKKIPTGNIPTDIQIVAEALIYIIESKGFERVKLT